MTPRSAGIHNRPVHLVVIFGPSAVGKMTVGRRLAALTGYRLFHNHLTIEPVREVFDHGTPPFARLVLEFRRRVIEEAVAADLPGLIFTCVWDLDDPGDRVYVDTLTGPVHAAGGRVSFVELYADQATRLAREGSPERLEHKRSKRDVEFARQLLLADDRRGRLNSHGDFPYPGAHHVVDNTHLTPAEAATQITRALGVG